MKKKKHPLLPFNRRMWPRKRSRTSDVKPKSSRVCLKRDISNVWPGAILTEVTTRRFYSFFPAEIKKKRLLRSQSSVICLGEKLCHRSVCLRMEIDPTGRFLPVKPSMGFVHAHTGRMRSSAKYVSKVNFPRISSRTRGTVYFAPQTRYTYACTARLATNL